MSGESSAVNHAAEGVWDVFKTVAYALLIALALRVFVFQPFSIPSGSMNPTLIKGDFIIVWKFGYGFSHHSIPFSPKLFSGRLLANEPTRGDVVVFKYPPDDRTDYVKRLVGMPGDRVQVIGGVLHINGEAVKREFLGERVIEEDLGAVTVETTVQEWRETLPNGKTYVIHERGDGEPNDNTQVFEVPANHYFMMGDNRDNSEDSRVATAVGYVPAENLVGPTNFVILSYRDGAQLWKPWTWVTHFRADRFANGVK